MKTLTHIQALRAWAAFGIVFFHLGGSFAHAKYFSYPYVDYFTRFGYAGIFLFFVLSGFLIHQIHERDFDRPERARDYIRKRVLRIFPLYLVVLASISLFSLATGVGAEGIPRDLLGIIRTVFLLPQNPSVVGGTGAPIVIVAWSLQYEMVFYAAILFFIIDKRLGWAMLVGFTVFWALMWSYGQADLFPTFMHIKYFSFFGMGVIASVFQRSDISLKLASFLHQGAWVSITALSFVSFGIMVATEGMVSIIDWTFLQVALGVLCAILIFGISKMERCGIFPAKRPLVLLGSLSYGIYLLHFPFISLFSKVVKMAEIDVSLSVLFVFASTILFSVGGSVILHQFVEKPGMKLARS